MKALLLIAHGSRRAESNDEVRRLAASLGNDPASGYDRVQEAFLELAQPSIPDGLECCILDGASEVVVFPYFLAAGRHVVTDIPAEIAPMLAKYPDVTVRLAPHLGASALLPRAILDLAGQ